MKRIGARARTLVALVAGALLLGNSPIPAALAQTPADRSEVVVVLDFSASILEDVANRNRFGAALERIADRVDETSADLVAGDATVTIVQFATRAADYPGCADLRLLDSEQTVAVFADCLRSVARAYRQGLDPALAERIGIDTNYVAAMEAAARHLPADAVRPALILFSDGKHDVQGVPVAEVEAARDRLFGDRSPLALLPVGMGLDPVERDALEAGLVGLRIIRDMPACVSGATFDWPQVVFESADDAGNAVAIALQDASCTFTVAPTPTPSPAQAPAAARGIKLTAGDGRIEVAWAAPAATPVPIVDYRVRCRADGGEWIESDEGVSLETKATVDGLANGTTYRCQVAVIGPSSEGAWTDASGTAAPVGRPAAPSKPSVEALDRALLIRVTPDDATSASGYRYECSTDGGTTWTSEADVASTGDASAEVRGLVNGVEYVCRAFAENAAGVSDASPVSDAVRPCGSLLECDPRLPPLLAGLGIALVGGLLLVLVGLYRDRSRGHVVAVVDVVHTANLGHGSRLGIAFVRVEGTRTVTGIVADRARGADIRIRQRRGERFEVTDARGRHAATSGEPIVVIDSLGVRHELVLWAFATDSAAAVTSRPS